MLVVELREWNVSGTWKQCDDSTNKQHVPSREPQQAPRLLDQRQHHI